MLLQLGGPASLDEVQPFLEEMFSDPALLDLPIPARWRGWLANRFSVWRARHVRPLYDAIGGGSPIGNITALQAKLLQGALDAQVRCKVFVAMRYGRPGTREAVAAVANRGCDRVVLLPLYPQFCSATTGSFLDEWNRRAAEAELSLPTGIVQSFASNPGYVEAVAERVREGLAELPSRPPPSVVFSAHGLPQKLVDQGDPYESQIRETVALVSHKCGLSQTATLCYQSRVGPQRWLRPSLETTLRLLGTAGVQSVLVVPISFVSDHLETLSEIDIEARQLASANGVKHFQTMRGLNDSPAFIETLAALAIRADRRLCRPAPPV